MCSGGCELTLVRKPNVCQCRGPYIRQSEATDTVSEVMLYIPHQARASFNEVSVVLQYQRLRAQSGSTCCNINTTPVFNFSWVQNLTYRED